MNNAHRQTLEMAGKILGASHRPKQTCANGTGWNGLERKKWNTWEGRPFVQYNFRSNRAFHLHLNRLNRKSLTWGDFSRPVSPRRESIFLYAEGLRVEVMPLSLMGRYMTNQLS